METVTPLLEKGALRSESASHIWHKTLMRSQGPLRKISPGCHRGGSEAERVRWREFLRRYERLTDLLCAAAKNGCDAKIETEYDAIRRWLKSRRRYVSALLAPFLSPGPSGTGTHRSGQALEAFEMMIGCPTLKELLESDGGRLIERVSALSDAVYMCDKEKSRSVSV